MLNENTFNKLGWQNSWVRVLQWSMLTWGTYRQLCTEMKICAKECHVNLFTNGQVQPNLYNVVHPFIESNGRSTHIWLNLMLKDSLKRFVNWSQIDKNDNLYAMHESVADSRRIKTLIKPPLTNKIND